jgi:hypothetical protein
MTDTAKPIDAEVKTRLSTALKSFFQEERKLLESDVREDGLSHRLAVHIERQFKGWDVDAEYDKMHIDGVPSEKKYIGIDGKEHHAIPDIIVHRRQTMENFVAIEIKKLGRNRGRERDFAKLTAYKGSRRACITDRGNLPGRRSKSDRYEFSPI